METQPGLELNRIITRAVSGGDIYKAFCAFFDCIHLSVPVDRMSVVQLDFDRKIIRIISQASSTGSEKTNFSYSAPVDLFALAENDNLPEIYIINEPETDPFGNNIAERTGGGTDWSLMGMSIKEQTSVYGMIFFIADNRNRFTDAHTRLLLGLKNEHKWLLDTMVQDHEKKIPGPDHYEPVDDKYEFFRQVTRRICGHLDLEAGALHCLQYLSRFMPVTVLSVYQREQDMKADREVVRVTGLLKEYSGLVIPRDPVSPGAPADTAVPKVKVTNQPERDSELSSYVKLWGSDWSAISMFLFHKKVPIGIAAISQDGKNRYTEEHKKLFSMLHDPFALGLSNNIKHREVIRLKNLLEKEKQFLKQEIRNPEENKIIGGNLGLKGVMDNARRVADQESPVLLSGETGVGKEIIANFIHQNSSRKDGPLIKVNCGAIPDTLVDSELFGHEKGAFTGAENRKMGRFERADRGTIFLDEIAELPLHVQVRLLRVLQNKIIERVGGTESIPVDIRIIAATNRNLEEQVASGQFREDLWFRLNVFPIRIPPLRSRQADIPALVAYFIEKKSREMNLHVKPVLSQGAMDQLTAYSWPGNVRELENVIERELILSKDGLLTFQTVIPRMSGGKTQDKGTADDGVLELDEVYTRHIKKVLALSKGKINGPGGAAEILKINPNTLRNRMKKLGIPHGWKKDSAPGSYPG